MTESDEREKLWARQATLEQRGKELQRETERLRGSRDLSAIRAHQELLKRHETELREFDENLGAFHERFGPLGHKKKEE
jgi:hypothetical protein